MRQPGRRIVNARVLAVDGAEPVADVQFRQRRQLIRERAPHGLVLAGLARVEAEVLQHDNPAG